MRRLRRLPLLLVIFLSLAGCQIVSGNQPVDKVRYYPGELKIEKSERLSPKERDIEARFAKYLEDNIEEAITLYRDKFGNVINTDNARELSKDYAPGGVEVNDPQTNAARGMWSNAVHEPASALVKEIYRRELKKRPGPDQLALVVFTAGGAAAGKTTAVRSSPKVADIVQPAQIVNDSTLSSWRSANQRIMQALEAGKKVAIVYVHRDPVEAFVNGALGQIDRLGRTLPLEVYLQTHVDAPRVTLQLAEKFYGDPRVAISVIDNSRGRGNAAVADLDFLRRISNKYTPQGLRAKLTVALEDAYGKGKRGEKGGISETVYRAFKGASVTGDH
jgi:hypothetical protein